LKNAFFTEQIYLSISGATNPTKIQNPNRRKDTIIFATLIAAFFLLLSITIAFGIANQQVKPNLLRKTHYECLF